MGVFGKGIDSTKLLQLSALLPTPSCGGTSATDAGGKT